MDSTPCEPLTDPRRPWSAIVGRMGHPKAAKPLPIPPSRPLTPEEESVDDPDDVADDLDDTLPADLWF